MKKLLFILNPRSGKGKIKARLCDMLDLFTRAGYETVVHVTQGARDAERKAARRGGTAELLICSGGDGTLNEVVSGLMALERRPALGYIPSGSTNDFAASLGLPKNMMKAAVRAVTGEPFAVDVGKFGPDRYFVYVAAFGAFTEVSYQTPQEAKNLLGHPAYMLEAVKRIAGLKSYRMEFRWGDQTLAEEFILGMVTNTVSVGGFKGLVPGQVALDDGEFEVFLVRTPRTPRDLQSIVMYLLTKEGTNDCVHQFRARSLKVTCAEAAEWTLDGEYGGAVKEVAIENIRQAIVIRR